MDILYLGLASGQNYVSMMNIDQFLLLFLLKVYRYSAHSSSTVLFMQCSHFLISVKFLPCFKVHFTCRIPQNYSGLLSECDLPFLITHPNIFCFQQLLLSFFLCAFLFFNSMGISFEVRCHLIYYGYGF